MIRLIYVLRRKPSMSRDEFQKYWHEVHGPLVARHATTLKVLRYVQDHTLDDPMNEQMARARGGMEPPYDGVAELWWTTREAFATSFASWPGRPPPKNWSKTKRRLSTCRIHRSGSLTSIRKSIPQRMISLRVRAAA